MSNYGKTVTTLPDDALLQLLQQGDNSGYAMLYDRFGAMIYGGAAEELIQLNESTLWTGGPVRTNVNPGAYANLLKAREALFNGENYAKAYEYAKGMQGYYSESYLPFAAPNVMQGYLGPQLSISSVEASPFPGSARHDPFQFGLEICLLALSFDSSLLSHLP